MYIVCKIYVYSMYNVSLSHNAPGRTVPWFASVNLTQYLSQQQISLIKRKGKKSGKHFDFYYKGNFAEVFQPVFF
jgi:hypothetical protein